MARRIVAAAIGDGFIGLFTLGFVDAPIARSHDAVGIAARNIDRLIAVCLALSITSFCFGVYLSRKGKAKTVD